MQLLAMSLLLHGKRDARTFNTSVLDCRSILFNSEARIWFLYMSSQSATFQLHVPPSQAGRWSLRACQNVAELLAHLYASKGSNDVIAQSYVLSSTIVPYLAIFASG